MNQKKAEADLAYDLQKFKTGQLVKAEEVQVQIVEKQKQIELQQQEILRKQRELEADRAEARRRRALQSRDAGQREKIPVGNRGRRCRFRDEGHGFCRRRCCPRPPASPRPRRTRRAVWPRPSVIEAQGKATASAMQAKAESFKQYNEAAVIEMIMRVLPEIAGKISEPLSKMEKMVIINSGNGPGGGASKLTGDVTQIISQLPPVLEALTGVKFEKLLEQVPALKKAMAKDDDEKK